MPAPVSQPGSYGNVIPDTSLSPGQSVSGLASASTLVEGRLSLLLATGPVAPKAATTFRLREMIAGGTPVVLSTAAPAGSTSLRPSDATGLHAGQSIAVSAVDGSWELLTVTDTPTAATPVTATARDHLAGDKVLLLSDPSAEIAPASASGKWAASSTYLPTWRIAGADYLVTATNGEAAGGATVAVSASLDRTVASYV